jgi:replicative DNA helicase
MRTATLQASTSPHSEEAEMALLGSMLIGGPRVIEDVCDRLRADAFFVPRNQTVFNHIALAHSGGKPLDMITFTQELRNQAVLESIGGIAYVTQLFTFVPTAVNVDYYVDIVREKWMRRQMIDRCTAGARQAYDESTDTLAILEDLQSNVIEIGQLANTHETLRPIGEAVADVVESIKATYRLRGKPIGLTTGFVDLDRTTGGFQKGRSYYVAARPAMGKSSLGTEFAEHLAIESAEKNHAVAIFSVEMTKHELTEVILCRRSEINLVRLRDGFLSKEKASVLDKQAGVLMQAPIYIDDDGVLSLFDFRARARRAIRRLKVELIIIDYIQRMKSTSKRAQMSRELEISEIAQGISATAKELQVPIVVLAQLNRETEKRTDGRPQLSDMRESGSMEAEAHFVGLLYRPSYYAKSEAHLATLAEKYKMDVEDFKRYTELIVAKQRRGPVGTVRLKFAKEYAKFEDEDPDRPLFSNRADERQQKDAEAAFVASVKEVFPAAAVMETKVEAEHL